MATSDAERDTTSPTMSLFDKVKIQAEVLIPLHRELTKRFGKQDAEDIIRSGLTPWAESLGAGIRQHYSGSPLHKLQQAVRDLDGQGVQETEFVKATDTELQYKIKRCAVAEFYRAAGLEELGYLFVCDIDFQAIKTLDDKVRLERPQTLMHGGAYCDFRFTRK